MHEYQLQQSTASLILGPGISERQGFCIAGNHNSMWQSTQGKDVRLKAIFDMQYQSTRGHY
jgi:hypothetical protein